MIDILANPVRRAVRPFNRDRLVNCGLYPRIWMEALESRRLFTAMMGPSDGLPVVPQPANAIHDPQINIVYIQWGSQVLPVVRGEWIIGIDVNAATWMQPPDMNESDWPRGDLYHTDRGMQSALDALGAGYKFEEYLGVWDEVAITVPDGVSYNQLEQTLSNLPGFTGSVGPDGIVFIADAPSSGAPVILPAQINSPSPYASKPFLPTTAPVLKAANTPTSVPAESLASSLLDIHDRDLLISDATANVLG